MHSCLTCPTLGAWPKTQALCPDWESIQQPFGLQPALNPLSYTSQGTMLFLMAHLQVSLKLMSPPVPQERVMSQLPLTGGGGIEPSPMTL